ncbi:MAG: SWIM zinc finger family protein [Gemmatimonadaceae bacterium]
MTARAKGGRDPRAAEYVDSPSMRMRLRDGRRLVVRVDGRYGCYRTELNLAAPNASSCSCPSEESPCKHVRALRKTWRVNPRSFLEIQRVLDGVSRQGRGALLGALRTIIFVHPALEKRRLIRRDPGQARSVRVLLETDEIPDLDA